MKKFGLGAVLVLVTAFTVYLRANWNHQEIILIDESDIESRWSQSEGTFVLIKGDFYRDHGSGKYSFIENYYDPDFFKKYYSVDENRTLMGDPSDPSIKIAVGTEYTDDFESYKTVRDLLVTKENTAGRVIEVAGIRIYDPNTLPTRWTTMTLQSPSSPTVKDYVKLRTQILEEGAGFVDNRIEPSTEKAHSGRRAIRFYSKAKSRKMVCCKSSISSETFHFVKGDEFCFSGWFYFEKGMPTTIMDLESTWLEKHSGIRILFSKSGSPSIELKAFEKPMWRNRNYQIPRGQWVKIEAEILLDEKNGELRLKVNDELVLEGTGQTLPLADTVLNSLEVGISACQNETILFLDDLSVGTTKLQPSNNN